MSTSADVWAVVPLKDTAEAKQRLERARADTPELVDARRKVQELVRKVTASPEPLQVAR